jgi:NADH:ubiquinone oxidoreductase subunit C
MPPLEISKLMGHSDRTERDESQAEVALAGRIFGAAGIDGERMMKQSAPFETVTKLEALERQLRVAIRMFFERKDMIVVHTLVGASQDALRQLGSARGVASMYDHAEKVIRRDKVKDFVNALRKAQIFFKHASSGDSDEKLKFYYSVTQFLLFDAALLCSALTGRLTPEVRTFLAWFIAKFPDVYIGDDREFKAALQADIDLDDFNIPLSVIEHMNKYGLPKVNTKST